MSNEPIDPDVDLRDEAQRDELAGPSRVPVLGVIALGGGLGALARHGADVLMPTVPGRFPWGTFTVNVVGCLLIGTLMVLITEVWAAHHLVRPFLGAGVLGGFTTFSTYAVEIRGLLTPGSLGIAVLYLAGTVVGAMLAVLAGAGLTRAAIRPVDRVRS